MHGAVVPNENGHWSNEAYHRAQSSGRPAAAVVELKQHNFGTGCMRRGPHSPDDGEEANDVNEKQPSFDPRQFAGEQRDEGYAEDGDSDAQK